MKKMIGIILALALATATTAVCAAGESETQVEGVYLGVSNYGQVDRDDAAQFTYRFSVGGEEQTFSLSNDETDSDGAPAYRVQNLLKEGYSYRLTVQDGTVTAAEELPWDGEAYTPPVSGTPGEKTVKNFLATALTPVGTTLYVYGGGWNWQDNGPSLSARTLGLSPDWLRFYREQDQNYTYRDRDGDESNKDAAHSYYPYGRFNEYGYAGLDCSGYVGWTLYNTLENQDGEAGYVSSSTIMAKGLSERGYGKWSNEVTPPDGSAESAILPGDVMSIQGHVWISLGTCADGSILMLHSSPTRSYANQPGGGVQIGAIGDDYNCEALVLAERYMSDYYADWHERYPVFLLNPERYIPAPGGDTGRFTWDTTVQGGLSDPEGVQQMRPEQVLKLLFTEKKS